MEISLKTKSTADPLRSEAALSLAMLRHLNRALFALLLCLMVRCPIAGAQVNLSQIIGAPENAHTLPVRFGFVNLDNGNLHLEIPLYSLPARGHPALTSTLVYDSTFWNYTPLDGLQENLYPTNGGWANSLNEATASPVYPDAVGGGVQGILSGTISCSSYLGSSYQGNIYLYDSFQSTDPFNTTRTFSFLGNSQLPIADAQCSQVNGPVYSGNNNATVDGYPQNGTAYAEDGSGYFLTVSKANGYESTGITSPNGIGGATPNGNLFGQGYGDELGSNYPTQTYQGFYQSWWGYTTGYLTAQPYTAYSPITTTISRPVWNGSSVGQALYIETWEWIPVCTGSVLWNSGQNYTDYCGGMWVLGSISIPGGGSYQFGYDEGSTPTHLGKLTSITLPSGGVVSYGYGPLKCGTTLCGGQVTSVSDNGGTIGIQYSNPNTNAGIGVYGPWVYYPVTVTYPQHATVAGGTTMIQDQIIYSATANTFTKTEYSGSSAVVRTTTTAVDNYGRATSVTATWNATGESHQVTYKYADDSSLSGTMTYGQLGINMVALATEYNNGSLVRSVQTTYLQNTSNINYVSQYNMINYPSVIKLMNSSGAVVSQIQYTYDEYSANYCSQAYPKGLSGIAMLTGVTGAAGHDDTYHGTSFLARGNPTTITYSGIGMPTLVTHKCYDTLGNVTQTVDGNGNATRFSYTDSFSDGGACLQAGLPTYAFPTTVTDALGHQTITSYYSCNRAPQSVKGPNDIANNRTGTVYTYDTAFRPWCVNSPDGGQSCTTYPSQTEADVTTLVNGGGLSNEVRTITDSFRRVTSTINNGSGVEVDTTYDAFNRINSVSNAYYQGSSTSGLIYSAYDPFGRITSQKAQDNSTQSWVYTGNTALFTDAVGNQWQRTSDSLGRLTKVLEPSGSSQSPSLETDYSYDALNNLLSVTQWGGANGSSGARTRSFNYDGASRLLCSSNPENSAAQCPTAPSSYVSGTIGYSYDANGNVITKTDARGITTQFGYDGLNRLISKTYLSDTTGTPISCFQYDSSSTSSASANLIGQLANAWSQPTRTSCTSSGGGYSPVAGSYLALRSILSYDQMGRPTGAQQQQCVGSQCSAPSPYSLTMVYDLIGDLASLTNSVGAAGQALTLTNYLDAASRPCLTTSSWSGSFPQNLFQVNPSSSTPGYAAFGGLQNWYMGSSSSTASTSCSSTPSSPINITQGYTNRLWVNSISAAGQIP